MPKTEVYSWRLAPELKAALERAARREDKPLAELLEEMARQYLKDADATPTGDEQRAREMARRAFGSIRSGRSDRSARTRALVRERLKDRRGT